MNPVNHVHLTTLWPEVQQTRPNRGRRHLGWALAAASLALSATCSRNQVTCFNYTSVLLNQGALGPP